MPSSTPQYSYPWAKVERGQGFFIPCLDTEAIRTEGLNQALTMRLFDAKGYPAITEGRIGVWFYRLAASHP
jgi:hypothetical protein